MKYKWLILLIFFAVSIRLIYISDLVIPFGFDHGKDSLAVLHMLVASKLKFIGPWTSIPGLYFGPGWYYLLAPFYFISGFNPVSAVWAMIFLIVLQIYLAYKYFGFYEAAIISSTSMWTTISRSAWNPFPMTLITLLILILLKKQLEIKKIDNKLLFLLFFVASFGFHFSAAFAIFYPLIILTILLWQKFKFNLKSLAFAGLGFIIPFIPQILFEFKNSFIETKSVISYFKTGGSSDGFSYNKILDIIKTIIGEVKISLAFNIREIPVWLNEFLFAFLIGILLVIFVQNLKDKKFKILLGQVLIFLIIPTLGFFFLHFNVWYVLALIPVFLILFSELLRRAPKFIGIFYILLIMLSAVSNLNFYLKYEKEKHANEDAFLPVKLKIIDHIREDAGGRDFSVYTYVSDIYDYAYQYLFIVQGLEGKKLPVEFSYRENEIAYIREKSDLLGSIEFESESSEVENKKKPEVIYYIVKNEPTQSLLNSWWSHQNHSKIVSEKKFGDNLTVYIAEPKYD